MLILGFLIISLLAQTRLGSVDGIVLRAGTSQPISNAVVELTGNDKSGPLAMATGPDGRFEFRNLQPGQYRLAVSRTGYLNSSYGQRGPNGSGKTLEVGAGQTMKDIRLAMIATGAISGRVYDSRGEPLANVSVRALKYAYLDGQRTLTSVKGDLSDDRGEYRLFWLPPGLYYVSAVPQGETGNGFVVSSGGGTNTFRITSRGPHNVDRDRSAAEKLGEADVPFYYPGTADPQAAMPVEVRSGADLGGVDFSLARVKTRKVSGILVDGLTGQLATSASAVLVPRYPSAAGSVASRPSFDGAFEIPDVLPGSYFIVATNRANAGGGAVRIMGARVPVDVGGTDVDRLSVVVSPAVDIRGEVAVEGPLDSGSERLHPIVLLKNDVAGLQGPSAQVYGSFSDSRHFVLNDVIEGDYQLQVLDLPKGTYVKSIRFGAADALNNSLHIDSRSAERIQIVLATSAGALEGAVINRNRDPVSNTPIALVPDAAHRQRVDLYKGAFTDEAGRFNLQGIPPGDYVLFAWEDIDESLWRDPEFIRRIEASGKPVRIVEGSRETVELTAIPFDF